MKLVDDLTAPKASVHRMNTGNAMVELSTTDMSDLLCAINLALPLYRKNIAMMVGNEKAIEASTLTMERMQDMERFLTMLHDGMEGPDDEDFMRLLAEPA